MKHSKKARLIFFSGLLILVGASLVIQQANRWYVTGNPKLQTDLPLLNVEHHQGQKSELQGMFPVDSVDRFTVQRNGKDAVVFLLAEYHDLQSQKHQVIQFFKNKRHTATTDPADIRQQIWQAAGTAIKKNTPENAVFLSWWDDGQRIHYLSGVIAWINKPYTPTFNDPVWQQLKKNFYLADDSEHQRLNQMARWLTMDYANALREIRQTFPNQPVYILVTSDLLLRRAELADYSGEFLSLYSAFLEAHDSMHGDIAHIKQWASENGDGNYLVQKEGLNYRVWTTPSRSPNVKNTLIVRLLPFIDSLRQTMDNLQLVYQSSWGGYLSIYKLSDD
jgi:hydroxylamine oxidation protein HaoB